MAASLLLRGGRILLRPSTASWAEALAVEGGRVVAAGRLEEVLEHCDARTEVLDLHGGVAVPGFGDAHIHPVLGGLEMARCNLLGTRSRQECLETIADHAAGLGPDTWLLGGGWAMEAFPGGLPDRRDLDAACGDRPAFLPNRDHHSAWVSTRALELAGIDRGTPDPPDGRIERADDGTPTGVLHEGAMALVGRLVPPPSPAELRRALRLAQAELHRLGVTFLQDACVGTAPELGAVDAYDTYRAADDEGWLTLDVVGALWFERHRGLSQLEDLLTRREGASAGRFRATSVKLMLDGVCETLTAAMTEPYLGVVDHGGHACGTLFFSPEELRAIVTALAAEGFQLHFHALGDRAVHVGLDALEAIPVGERHRARHHLAHLQFVRPEDLPRFAQLGATANFQPLWACNDPQMTELTLPRVGPERASWQYRIASLAGTGARVAFGSDWPVSSPDPLEELYVAVHRRLSPRLGVPGTPETEEPLLPQEAVDLYQGLAAFTEAVAWVNHREGDLGALLPGYLANVAVLDHDPFGSGGAGLEDCRVVATLVEGAVVHDGTSQRGGSGTGG
ncbi:amidohydrolase [Aciditerrimonas ferrireducens]|uniref:Amidohydrolase n=1 Tax=Aciditerrimonas ferrireducens TaxID=667306 RepID=A0ABV6BYZ6_9ACTN